MPDNEHHPAVGIDLGTTYSSIARWKGDGAEVYNNHEGDKSTPSVVYRAPNQKAVVGLTALNQGNLDPLNLQTGFKRDMDNGAKEYMIGGEKYTPITLSAEVLKKLNGDVLKQNGMKFDSRYAIVTVPYYFKAHQCENTRQAAKLAGINCQELLQEPIAASLSYAWKMAMDAPKAKKEEKILVYDLGGGTFDLTLFRLEQSPNRLLFEVYGTGGQDHLGGLDFDQCLADMVLKKANIDLNGLSESAKRRAEWKLATAAIDTKIRLGFVDSWDVIIADLVPGKHVEMKVTRPEFEKLLVDYRARIQAHVDAVLMKSGCDQEDVDRVVLVGGSSKIPCLRQDLAARFGEKKLWMHPDPALCVVEGAALYAAFRDDPTIFPREIQVIPRTCHALGIETTGKRFHTLVASNQQIPPKGTIAVGRYAVPTNQTTGIEIKVYQGPGQHVGAEAPITEAHSHIGTLKIFGIPPNSKGKAVVVTFQIGQEQNLTVTAELRDAQGKTIQKVSSAMKYA